MHIRNLHARINLDFNPQCICTIFDWVTVIWHRWSTGTGGREISREQASLWKGEIAEQGSKMIITESLGKRGKSTRDIARKLTDKDYCISNKAVYRCLRSHSSYTWRNRRHTRIYSKRHNNFTPRAVKMDTYFKTEFPIIFSEIRNLTALDR